MQNNIADPRIEALISDLREWHNGNIQTATASGGRVIAFPSGRRTHFSARVASAVGDRHGKCASFTITKAGPQAIFYDDVNDEVGDPKPFSTDAVCGIAGSLVPPPILTQEYNAKLAGSTAVFAIRLNTSTDTRIGPAAVAAALKSPGVLDLHVYATEVLVLVARTSKLTHSIAQLLRSSRISTRKAPQRRKHAGKPRKRRRAGVVQVQ